MKITISGLLLTISMFIFSCTTSEQEQAAMHQKLEDSVKVANENLMMQQEQEQQNELEQNNKKNEVLNKLQTQFQNLESLYNLDEEQLDILKNKLQADMEFHFVNHQESKEHISNDRHDIEKLKKELDNIGIQLNELKRQMGQAGS